MFSVGFNWVGGRNLEKTRYRTQDGTVLNLVLALHMTAEYATALHGLEAVGYLQNLNTQGTHASTSLA